MDLPTDGDIDFCQLPAPRTIRRPRPDQSSRLLSNGCSSPRLPRRRGGRLLATATPPARLSGRLTAALAGNESFEPVPLRSCGSAPSQAAISSPLAVRVRAAQSATWRMPMTAQSQPPPTARSTCGSQLRGPRRNQWARRDKSHSVQGSCHRPRAARLISSSSRLR